MNQLLSYEEHIAKKMEHLHVPDISNTVWNNIQDQLKIEGKKYSKNDSRVIQNVSRRKKEFLWLIGVGVVIIVCVFLLKQKKHVKSIPVFRLPKKSMSLPKSKSTPVQAPVQVPKAQIATLNLENRIVKDNTKIIPITTAPLFIATDGISTRGILILDSILNTSIQSNARKSIGVTDINSNSYQIVGVKDSIK